MEVTEPLVWEHETVLGKLEAFEKALASTDWQGVRDTLKFFDERLSLHRRKEEEILFPVLGRHLGTTGGPIACMLHEHQDEREKIEAIRAALQRGSGDPTAWTEIRAAGSYILSLLRTHIGKENQILYPMAEQLLGPDEKEAVAKAMNAMGYCWTEVEAGRRSGGAPSCCGGH